MLTCGVWLTPRRLIAVPADDGAALHGYTAERTDDGRWALLASIEANVGLDVTIVVSQGLQAADTLPRFVARRGMSLLVAPEPLVLAAQRLVCGPRASARALALMLTRLPLCPPLASQLLRFEMQLPLL